MAIYIARNKTLGAAVKHRVVLVIQVDTYRIGTLIHYLFPYALGGLCARLNSGIVWNTTTLALLVGGKGIVLGVSNVVTIVAVVAVGIKQGVSIIVPLLRAHPVGTIGQQA